MENPNLAEVPLKKSSRCCDDHHGCCTSAPSAASWCTTSTAPLNKLQKTAGDEFISNAAGCMRGRGKPRAKPRAKRHTAKPRNRPRRRSAARLRLGRCLNLEFQAGKGLQPRANPQNPWTRRSPSRRKRRKSECGVYMSIKAVFSFFVVNACNIL